MEGGNTAAFARASRVAPTVQFVRKAATFELMQRLMLSSTCVHTPSQHQYRTLINCVPFFPFHKSKCASFRDRLLHLRADYLYDCLCERLVDAFFAGTIQDKLFDRGIENLQPWRPASHLQLQD